MKKIVSIVMCMLLLVCLLTNTAFASTGSTGGGGGGAVNRPGTVTPGGSSTDEATEELPNEYVAEVGRNIITVDAEVFEGSANIELYENEIFSPLRLIGEALEAVVDWNGETQEATFTIGDKSVVATFNNGTLAKIGEDNLTYVNVEYIFNEFLSENYNITADDTKVVATKITDNPVVETTIVDSGNFGGNLSWTLNSNGLLTISGNGAMPEDLASEATNVPWYSYKEEINSILILDGVTTIGFAAFSGCVNLTDVSLPNTLTDINENAFAECESLTEISFPHSVTRVGREAFYNCISLKTAILSSGLSNVGENTFYGCKKLGTIIFPKTITSVSEYAFGDCRRLSEVYYEGSEAEWLEISIADGNEYLTSDIVIFDEYYRVSGISFDNSEIELLTGLSKKIEATIIPEEVLIDDVIWHSSDESIIALNNTKTTGAWVTALSAGEATITARTFDGSFIAECNVIANNHSRDIDGDNKMTTSDVVYLSNYIDNPATYPTVNNADINGDGDIDTNDMVYLLKHIMLPEKYPLN